MENKMKLKKYESVFSDGDEKLADYISNLLLGDWVYGKQGLKNFSQATSVDEMLDLTGNVGNMEDFVPFARSEFQKAISNISKKISKYSKR